MKFNTKDASKFPSNNAACRSNREAKTGIFTPSYYKGWCEAITLAKENFMTPDLCKNVIDCVNVCDKLLEQDDFVISENRPSMPPHPGLWFWEEDGTFRAPKWSDT